MGMGSGVHKGHDIFVLYILNTDLQFNLPLNRYIKLK
jgi:hypothetical protein